MKPGGDPRRRARAATILVALALLPVAVMTVIAHSPVARPTALDGALPGATIRARDLDLPAADAVHRSLSSSLFAPFTWDGLVASGPFVRFDYLPGAGTILNYVAVNGSESSVILSSIQIEDFSPLSAPVVSGATFAVAGNNVMIVAHDDPTALLEIRTLRQPLNVSLRFPDGTTDLEASHATVGPASSLSFTDANASGRMIVGHGNLSVNRTIVSVYLTAQDYLALRAVPVFAEHAAARTAVLDAFGSGRLAAEFDFVAVSDGGWLENSAQFHAVPGLQDSSVQFNRAAVSLDLPRAQGGLVLMAFDPTTMPADPGHNLVVRVNGSDVPQSLDPLASLFALPGSSDRAAYVRLPMNATVLAVYLPDLSPMSIQISSVAVPPPGIDRPTQLGIVAAMFVVAIAAAIMFRRQST
ncbi:MAG TPA: hypothetical protein VEY12_09795 [Thermoplasmata archaeon]|nr:hypothetical protein [Thermoplasmata archaeon]